MSGTQLVDAKGSPVVLRGVSSHGLTWYPEYVNEGLFLQLSEEWDCNLVRLALYTDDYVGEGHDEAMSVLHRGIDAAIAADMYVLVDWHILSDCNPLQRLPQAIEFFDQVSREYAGVPNIIYEICNEPNGETTWQDVRSFSNQVIPIIRQNSPEAVIIVGTTTYDRDLVIAARDPLEYPNVMYTCHFYAASHGVDLRGEISAALDAGLPVFITECGLCEASGDGTVDLESAAEWFSFLADRNLSFAVWSLSNKAESSAFVRPTSTSTTSLSDDDLTPVGLWVRSLVRGEDPRSIIVPASAFEVSFLGGLWEDVASTCDLRPTKSWPTISLGALLLVVIGAIARMATKRLGGARLQTYDDLLEHSGDPSPTLPVHSNVILCQIVILLSTFLSLVYLGWRVLYSIPLGHGWVAVAGSLILLAIEALGLVESLVHYQSMAGMRMHPLPKVPDDEYPEVNVFVATYSEPVDLLRRTLNGCVRLRYPDTSKVHVWLCDDNRRPEMRRLAEEMGVGYFDRPDNEGAKAGNLNHAMGLTHAPYVVTFDADMIPRSDFLLKTIPYFVDAEHRNASLPEGERIHLGLLQTPQAFYDPDVFQHALYSERRVPNEQDFFYRTIEVAKTSTNSVIYGGSNTVLSRKALDAVGGFYTESITEDFATGLLIESAGFVSLAIPEPLASGRTPSTFDDHVRQRTRWGRGVIRTARKLGIMRRSGLSIDQRLSYWSSVTYWYSPIKNLVYLLSPLLFALLNLPVFICSWLDLLVFWLPMHVAQTLCLRVTSGNSASAKWSGIHETSVMVGLLAPIVKELLGISMTSFAVTDKSGDRRRSPSDSSMMRPYLVLLALSSVGIIRVIVLLAITHSVGLLVILFWLARNAYYLAMTLFLIDGRDSDGEPVKVIDAEVVTVRELGDGGMEYYGVTTLLTEHGLKVFLDEAQDLHIGERVRVEVGNGDVGAAMEGAVIGVVSARRGNATVHTIEILEHLTPELDYLQILYDRVPTLPQTITRDFNSLEHLWRNVAYRIERTVR